MLLVSGMTTILAIVDASKASAQARFAAQSTRPWGGCCSGIPFYRARKTSRARRATIPPSVIPTVWTYPLAQTALDWAPHEHSPQATRHDS